MKKLLKKLLPNKVKRPLKNLFELDNTRMVINERLGATEGRVGATDARLGATEGRVGATEGRLDALEKSVATLMFLENVSAGPDDGAPPFSVEEMHPNELAKLVRKRNLRSAETLEEIRQVAADMGYSYFLDYDQQIETKKREFLSAIDFFDISLRGARVLDVGPGTADGLDAAKARGAAVTMFIAEEPFFV